jgi:Domain of unknown function (DUF4349)
MNSLLCGRASAGSLRITALGCAVLMAGTAMLLAGCAAAGPSGAGRSAAPAARANGSAAGAPAAAQPAAAGASSSAAPAKLDLSGASIVYSASLTVRARNVGTAATQAASIAGKYGGYVSSEQALLHPPDHGSPKASIQLKIPVGAYPAALADLTALGTRISLSQQAQDVTEQVADVGSRVASARAAIAQLQALLARAGSIPDLLNVQQQISSQESALEQLEADQRALSTETAYATISLTLVSPPALVRHAAPHHPSGFLAGLTAGWHGLRATVSAILMLLGAILPFAAIAAVLAAAGYAARRWRIRRRARPTTAE